MSAGKSTLINSLLGKELLTTNSQACTAKVMEIIDNDDNTFSAIAKDDLGNPIKSFSNVTAENIKEINSNSSIKKVEIKGNIPFVDTKESYLALLDSPGTNYTEDPTHKTATLEMIRNSTKVLVIFVIDAGNAGTNDQRELFKAISESMNGTKDKQLKERFLFVINKIDKTFDDIEKNLELHLQDVINKIAEPLKDFGIENPNIFPVSAEIAFKIRNFNRILEREKKKLTLDIELVNENEEFYLEKYSKLPNVNKEIIDKELKEAIQNNDIKKQALIHSGIRNLEEAIKNYCSKNNNVIKNNYLGGKMKTYLVTGAAGFIGANYLKYILNKYKKEENRVIIVDVLTYAGNLGTITEEIKDERVTFEKVDIRDQKEIARIFSENEVDFVVNFAAESHVDRSIENPQIFLETNILGTQNLLENAKRAWTVTKDENGYPIYKDGVKYLQVSTDEVYGSLSKDYDTAIDLVIDDEEVKKVVKNRTNLKTYGKNFFTEKTSLDPRSPYSASKASADHIVIAYGETYKMPINITRCSNNYGPYHFPEKLIPLMIKNVLEGKKLPVYGKGDNVRDWLYVEDHCKGIDLVLRNADIYEIYNIGGFNEEQNINIVKLVIDILKEEIESNDEYKKVLKTDLQNINYDLITYVQDRLGHDMRYAIDPSKIARDLGWYPETDFETGIRKTVKWYLEHQEWVNEVVSGDYQKYYEEMYGNE